MKSGTRIFTSNVDGHFQKAGFTDDVITEVHGSIHHLQCTRHCGEIWQAAEVEIVVDSNSCRSVGKVPRCACGALARPNILMFDDDGWRPQRTLGQEKLLYQWLENLEGHRLVVVECGAGTAIPTVRCFSERTIFGRDATLIRINLRDFEVPSGHIAIQTGALAALQGIDGLL
jgi:NAD-dependent SIR2 family protein deacetylase